MLPQKRKVSKKDSLPQKRKVPERGRKGLQERSSHGEANDEGTTGDGEGVCGQYRKATKKEKGTILDRFMEATGYQRHYAARLLRNQGRRVRLGPRVVLQGEVSVRWRRNLAQTPDPGADLLGLGGGRPGFVEMDLVAHEGGRAQGDYLQTLDLTDVATGWIELEAVLNKAQVWVFEALQRIRQRLPFPLLGVDSDNGAEFINHHMRAYCENEKITFTRSRPYRKNDNCFVEQKNYSVVRRFAGYDRYQGAENLRRLNELYRWVRLYVNFFMPSQKLREKGREGSRVWKRYDPAKTPYQRVLDSTEVSAQRKRRLRARSTSS